MFWLYGGDFFLHCRCCLRVEWTILASSGFSGTSGVQAKVGHTLGRPGVGRYGDLTLRLDQAGFTSPFNRSGNKSTLCFYFLIHSVNVIYQLCAQAFRRPSCFPLTGGGEGVPTSGPPCSEWWGVGVGGGLQGGCQTP